MPDFDKMVADAIENPILSTASEDIGKQLTTIVINEMTLVSDPTVKNQSVWGTMREAKQAEVIARVKDRVKDVVTKAFAEMLAAGNPAAKARLKDVKFGGDKITAGLEIDVTCQERHALADSAGGHVAVIMPTELEPYFESMSEITATPDQRPLDLKKSNDKTPDDAGDKPDDDKTEDDGKPDDDDTQKTGTPNWEDPDPARTLSGRLASVSYAVPVSIINEWDPDRIQAVGVWLEKVEQGEAVEDGDTTAEFMAQFVVPNEDADDTDGPLEGTEPEEPAKPRTKKVLVPLCYEASADIGENLTKKELQAMDADHLEDYLAYCQRQKAEKDAAAGDEASPAGDKSGNGAAQSEGGDGMAAMEADPGVLSDLLHQAGVKVDEFDCAQWDEPTRLACVEFAHQKIAGKMPENIPNVLEKYILGR